MFCKQEPGISPSTDSQPPVLQPEIFPQTSQSAQQQPNLATGPQAQSEGRDMASLLQLLGKDPQADLPQSSTQGKQHTFDPFEIMFQGSVIDQSKCKDIREYVTVMQERRENSPSFKLGEMQFCLANSKPKLDDISPLQYMEASLRIVRESAMKEGADLSQVLQQLSYIIKIAILGQRFQFCC